MNTLAFYAFWGIVVLAVISLIKAKHIAQSFDSIAEDLHRLARCAERNAAGWRGYERAKNEEAKLQGPHVVSAIGKQA